VCCETCIGSVTTCPVCRAAVDSWMRIFIP
jgi:hypothetical protein